MVDTGNELIDICSKKKMKIWEYVIEEEMKSENRSREEVFKAMTKNFYVMKDSAEYGLTHKMKSISGLTGGDAYKLNRYYEKGETLTGKYMIKAMARALSCSEVNAAMGKIVAAPTAGSCGIIPGAIITAGEILDKKDEDMIKGLFTASGVGIIIAKNASMSGAEGGCQAECGSAAAMAAAGIVEIMGGTPKQALDAAAIVIKNIMGLVCDPVAGLVEIPCAKRNVGGTVSALTTADMVMAGVCSKIPFDDTVLAMYKVGRQLPCELRETALGGVAVTDTGLKLKEKVLGNNI
ncbi:L-serine ammonia-lyase, iron-sulfur-dependent, subunit alpha [Clostridium kluyveri]|uniref:L-serine dehydratase n=1 Tax=Clostridium kluyveri TaxID=1534 RepID=A0A1L5F543_CLOKL|nr:L-serine ammonia-lyase, iron-sulfur-dependent, subunit alpha [Clostridium kluyveri]APM38072.1 L-serine dehydratase, iron-sulfur-dependent subunit alpha [Clostridium kluyveri]UZQ51917.1 L-serine ammonia-lyase, iron-sulfur-dependent, subunit alpha [Clostridium kluyveri]